jgi:hypothetical protein
MVTAVMFSSGTAYAAGDCIGCTYIVPEPSAAYGTHKLKNTDVMQNPIDSSNLNQSPIRGRGAIKVMHTELAPDEPEAEIIKAIRLLTDNGYRISKR